MPKRKPPTDAPPLTPRTPMQDRIALNRKVKMFYDLQRLRIQAAGRGLKKGDENPIQLHEHDVYVLNSRAESLHAAEKAALRDIDDHLKTIPFYVNVLSDKDRYRGIGPTMAGVILSSFDIYREDTPSKMWSFCLPPGEPILSEEGLRAIEHIEIGERVIARDGNWTPAVDTLQRAYDGALIRIKASRLLPFNVTAEHPVLVVRGGEEQFVEAQAVIVGDYLVVPRAQTAVDPPPLDLRPYVGAAWKLPVTHLPVNERTALVYGRFVADGATCMSIERGYTRGHLRLSFGGGKPREEYATIIREEFHVEPHAIEREDWGNQTVLQFGRTAFAKCFREHFGMESHTKRVPLWIMDAPLPIVRQFLRGYFEGDGSVVKSGKSAGVQWANTVSPTLAAQLQYLCAKTGTLAGVSLTKRAGQKALFRGQEYPQRDRYNIWLHTTNRETDLGGGVITKADRFYCRVKRVTETPYSGPVYNLTTGAGTFCVSSAVTHNCGLAPVEARRCRNCFTLVEPIDADLNNNVTRYKHVVARAPVRAKPGDVAPAAEPKSKCPSEIHVSATMASAKAMRPTKGEKLPYNAFLKTKLVGVLGPVMLKVGSPWRKQYDDFKNRWASASPPKGRNDGHRHQAAIRYMIKMLLLDIWREWRTALELPVREAYAVEKQGRPTHNGGAAHVAPAPAADGPSYDAEIAAELGYLEENGGAAQ